MDCTLEFEQEADGRWLAEVPELPGAMAYGATRDEALVKAEALALRVLAERLENSESKPQTIRIALKACPPMLARIAKYWPPAA
jgi:predicted RNase H-like HicB family nuclease